MGVGFFFKTVCPTVPLMLLRASCRFLDSFLPNMKHICLPMLQIAQNITFDNRLFCSL